MADRGADARDLAGGDRRADTRATDENAPLGVPAEDRLAELAAELVRAFLRAEFDGGERYVERLRKVEAMEKEMKDGHVTTA